MRSAYLVCVFEIEVCLYVVKFLLPGQRLIQSYCLGSFGPGTLHRALFSEQRLASWRCPYPVPSVSPGLGAEPASISSASSGGLDAAGADVGRAFIPGPGVCCPGGFQASAVGGVPALPLLSPPSHPHCCEGSSWVWVQKEARGLWRLGSRAGCQGPRLTASRVWPMSLASGDLSPLPQPLSKEGWPLCVW